MQGEMVAENLCGYVDDWPQDNHIDHEARVPIMHLVAEGLVLLSEEALDDILRPSYWNIQNEICSVLYYVLEHMML